MLTKARQKPQTFIMNKVVQFGRMKSPNRHIGPEQVDKLYQQIKTLGKLPIGQKG